MWSYRKAVAYLESFIHYEKTPPRRRASAKTFNLESFRRLLAAMDSPQEKLRVVHVAGTKGKGSTCAMMASILAAAGYRVGLYTSPHLISYRERIQINGMQISEQRFARQIAHIKKVIDASGPRDTGEFRTTFEILTAAAFLEFVDRKVDFAVVETGLGGTLDATNVVMPDVAVLTSISLDHTEILGKTIKQIARDKVGIIKPGCDVIVGPQTKEAMGEITGDGRQGVLSAGDAVRPLLRRPPDIQCYQRDWKISSVDTTIRKTRWHLITKEKKYRALACPLIGRHQAENGSLAVLAATRLLQRQGVALKVSAMRRGLRTVRWQGRFQMLRRGVVLDGAHNVESARRLAQTYREVFPKQKAVVVLGISKEKDIAGIIRELAPIAAGIIATQANIPRAMPAEGLARVARRVLPGIPVSCVENIRAALALGSMAERPRHAHVLLTGSLFLVGEALQIS